MISACVSKTTSALTEKADPVVAVQRYVDLGLEYIKRDDFHRARRHLNRALEIDNDDPSANAALALIYHHDGEVKKAEELFRKGFKSGPEYTRGRSYYAAFLFAEKRFQEALEQFLIAAEDSDFQGRSQIYSNIALCHLKLGQLQQAVDAYTKTLRLDRFDAKALFGISEILIQINEFERAQHHYNRLVRLIRERGMQHSAKSLWLGVRIAHYFDSTEQEASLSNLLNTMYPGSEENIRRLERVNVESNHD